MDLDVNYQMNNNDTENIGEQSGNMYTYNDNTMVPHESNAIRRSAVTKNPNMNIEINNNSQPYAPNSYLDQFEAKPSNIIEESKNQNIPGYYGNKSSEERLPNNQRQIRMYPNEQYDKYGSSTSTNRRNPPQKKFYTGIYILIWCYHILMIILIGCFYKFDFDPSTLDTKDYLYGFYKDIHLIFFVGFGMLYTFLKVHRWSSIAIVLFIGIISIEFAFFCYFLWFNIFYYSKWEKIKINFNNLACINFISTPVIITLGALIGKLSISQYFLTAIIETFFASLNYFLCYKEIKTIDTGGSLSVHTFGATFGIMMSIVLFCKEHEFIKISNSPYLKNNYYSNIFSFIGSMYIWLFFPSFNVATLPFNTDDNYHMVYEILRYRGIINTYLSMIGSVMSAFIVTPMIYKGQLKFEHIINASFSGGIIIAGSCAICSTPWGALLIGCIGGVVCILGLWYLQEKLKRCYLEDTLGILHIFGIPGFLGGLLTSIFIGNFSIKRDWGDQFEIKNLFPEITRTIPEQAGIQIASIFVTIAIAGASGIVTGFTINSMVCDKNESYFVDSELFTDEETFPLPSWIHNRPNDINLSSSENKLNVQEREVNIEQ